MLRLWNAAVSDHQLVGSHLKCSDKALAYAQPQVLVTLVSSAVLRSRISPPLHGCNCATMQMNFIHLLANVTCGFYCNNKLSDSEYRANIRANNSLPVQLASFENHAYSLSRKPIIQDIIFKFH